MDIGFCKKSTASPHDGQLTLSNIPIQWTSYRRLHIPGEIQFLGHRNNSFTAQPPDLLLRFYIFPSCLIVWHPFPPFSLVSGFCSLALRLCYIAFFPPAIASSNLRFAALDGKYPWQDFHLQELCYALHTKEGLSLYYLKALHREIISYCISIAMSPNFRELHHLDDHCYNDSTTSFESLASCKNDHRGFFYSF